MISRKIRTSSYGILKNRTNKMKINKKRFRRMFPNLAKEMIDQKMGVSITTIKTNIENAVSDKNRKYNPDVIDFLKRCSNEHEAREIIGYLEKRGEISKEYAAELKSQRNERGKKDLDLRKKTITTSEKLKSKII